MKKNALIFFFLCVFANLYAQHINFMGIPLGQTKDVTDHLLRQNGFKYEGYSGNGPLYKGDFWIYNGIRLRLTVEGRFVTAITVEILDKKYKKKEEFNKLVNNLNSKYGKIYSKKNISQYFYFYYWKVKGGFISADYFLNEYKNFEGFSLSYIDYTNKTFEKPVVVKKRNKNNDL